MFLAFRDDPAIAALMTEAATGAPLFDVTAPDGVRHTVWRTPDPTAVEKAFQNVDAAYIADGHHRAAAAARVARERRTRGPATDGFLATLFPASSLRICGYHRCVADLNGLGEAEFLKAVDERFDRIPVSDPGPPVSGSVVMWLGRQAHRLRWKRLPVEDPAAALDAGVLQHRLLEPILGIQDPRKDKRISFVGGLDGADKVRRRILDGHAGVGFVLAPVSMADIMRVSDAGRVMPPKSTWFEPKLRSGLLIHALDG